MKEHSSVISMTGFRIKRIIGYINFLLFNRGPISSINQNLALLIWRPSLKHRKYANKLISEINKLNLFN